MEISPTLATSICIRKFFLFFSFLQTVPEKAKCVRRQWGVWWVWKAFFCIFNRKLYCFRGYLVKEAHFSFCYFILKLSCAFGVRSNIESVKTNIHLQMPCIYFKLVNEFNTFRRLINSVKLEGITLPTQFACTYKMSTGQMVSMIIIVGLPVSTISRQVPYLPPFYSTVPFSTSFTASLPTPVLHTPISHLIHSLPC